MLYYSLVLRFPGQFPFRFPPHRQSSPNSSTAMGNALSLAVSIGGPLIAGQIVGLWSAPDVLNWYPKLNKPSWAPPIILFGPIWGLLYTAMGYASWRVWTASSHKWTPTLTLYVTQLLLNLAWQPIFFKSHNLKFASQEISVLLGLVAATVYQFFKVDEMAGSLMIPYFAFTGYATALTWAFRVHNGDTVE